MSRRQGSSAPESQRSSSRLTNNSSSSNSTADQRSSRKRPVEEVVIDEENETPNKETIDDMPVPDVARKYDVNSFVFHPNDKDVHKFEALTPAVQAQCVKAVCRLFVMKAARKEPISRETIRAVLNEIDADYKKHVAAVLKRVQYQLLKSLGYVVVAGDSILGMKKNGKSDDYYVTNNLSSPKLMKLLNQAKRFSHINQAGSTQRNASSSSSSSSQPRASSRRESSSRPNYNEDQLSENEDDAGGAAGGTGSGGTTIAFVGFLVLVCGTIYTAPQKRISCEDLLAHIRKVDPRFPTRLTSAKEGSSVCPVPELEEQFVSLIRRLVKEHYLVGKRPEGGDKGEENVVYSLGSRFFLDIGRKELMIKYFQLMDQPMDEYIMKEIEEDAKKEEAENGREEEDEGGAAATVTAPAAAAGASSSSSAAGAAAAANRTNATTAAATTTAAASSTSAGQSSSSSSGRGRAK